MKRLIKCMASLCLAFVLMLTMMPLLGQTAYAETEADVTENGLTLHLWYSEYGASVAVRKYSGSATQIVLPSSVTYGGTTYDAAKGTADLFIESNAFSGNTAVSKIAIPNGYHAISDEAFKGCSSLTELAIGDSMSSLSNNAFKGCPAVTYYFKGENVPVEQVKTSGIGTDASGNPIAGVTVWTKEGSNVDKAIKELNEGRPEGKKITLKYDDDPYSKNSVSPSPSDRSPAANPETRGEDGTAIGKGASESLAVKTLQSYSSESDPAGSAFNLVQAKLSKAAKSSLKLSWKRPSGAVKFIVLGNKCGKSNKLVLQKTLSGTSYNVKKVSGKKLKKGTYYKFIVIAVDARGKVVSTSKIVHACTKGGKTGNDKKVTTKAKKNNVNLKKGKKFKLGAKPVPVSKALKVKRHRGIKYETSDKSIATVTSKGVIKGKKKGKCYVYAYAQNGVAAKIKVTVK